MQIDWITVTAQIINFLILVWLLKHFLYQPVMDAMSRREQNITNRLNEAEQRQQQADEKVKLFEAKSNDLEQERKKILEESKNEAGNIKRQMLDEARKEVAGMRENWLQQLNEEKNGFMENLSRQTIDMIQATARMALNDLADANLEAHIIENFVDQLKNLDKASCKLLINSPGPLRITTSYELDTKQQNVLKRAVSDYLEKGREVEFTQSSDLGCGIELSNGGQSLGWNLSDYMDDLTARINRTFTLGGNTGRVEA